LATNEKQTRPMAFDIGRLVNLSSRQARLLMISASDRETSLTKFQISMRIMERSS